MFSFLRADISIPSNLSVVSGLIFVTANSPTANTEGGTVRPPKVQK
jgi:hypothetical protein